MKPLFGLVLVLLRGCYGVGSCHDEGVNVTKCHGVLGGNVTLTDVSAVFRCDVRFKSEIIIRWRNNGFLINKENRAFIFPNTGTLGMKNLSRNDDGEYQLSTLNKEGTVLEAATLLLTVEAPVTSVQLVSSCLSQGEMHVSCSSEDGDTPEYSWTLNGDPVKDTDLLSGNTTTNIITLKQNVEGRLVCSVKNHVSSVSKEEQIASCEFEYIDCVSNGTNIPMWVHKENKTLCGETKTASSSTAHIGVGVFFAMAVVLAVGAAICFYWRRKKNSEGEEEDVEALTYADLRIGRMIRSVEQKVDDEVKYSEVKFSEEQQPSDSTTEECVYAEIRKQT